MPIIVKFFGEIIKMPKIDNVLYLSLQSLGYGWNDRHQIFLLIFIDNSIFYCRSKEFRNVTLNTVFVISHCLHLSNVLRRTISCKNNLQLCDRRARVIFPFIYLQISRAKSSTQPPAHTGSKSVNHVYTYSILYLYEYRDLVTLAKSYVDVSFINVNSNRSLISQVNTTAAIKWLLIVSNLWSKESKLFWHWFPIGI